MISRGPPYIIVFGDVGLLFFQVSKKERILVNIVPQDVFNTGIGDHIGRQRLNGLDYPEIGYKRVMGLLQLHKAYGSDRLDKACKRNIIGASMPRPRVP